MNKNSHRGRCCLQSDFLSISASFSVAFFAVFYTSCDSRRALNGALLIDFFFRLVRKFACNLLFSSFDSLLDVSFNKLKA